MSDVRPMSEGSFINMAGQYRQVLSSQSGAQGGGGGSSGMGEEGESVLSHGERGGARAIISTEVRR